MNRIKIQQILAIALLLSACNTQIVPLPTATPVVIATLTPAPTLPRATATPAPTTTPSYPWTDASAVMGGICFESAYDAAGRTFVIRTSAELVRFFDLADGSGLCRLGVGRREFDFDDGRILAGIWTRGAGCAARHEVGTIQRDDENRRLTIYLTLITEGDCPYELVQPFWIALDGVNDYAVEFIVEQ